MTAYISFRVSGRERLAPAALWDALAGPKPPPSWPCDGCSWSPDWWRGLPFWLACRVHDHCYSHAAPLGGTWASRREADRIFRQNLHLICDAYGIGALRRASVLWLYWSRVRLYGSRCFLGWREAERPADLSWWQRVREVYGLFRARDDAFDAGREVA